MSWPTISVQIDVTHDPNDPAAPAPTWVDITPYVAGAPGEGRLDIERGRDYELDEIAPGTADIGLDNRTGRFDSANASGPYYPNLRPMRQIRARATYNAVTYDLFRGLVERWPQEWTDGGLRGRSEITAVDALTSLAQTDLLAAWVAQARAYGATSVMPLTDVPGAGSVVDLISGQVGRVRRKNGGSVIFGGEPPVEDLGSATFTPNGHIIFTDPLVTNPQFSVEAIFAVVLTGSEYAGFLVSQGEIGDPTGGTGLAFRLFAQLGGDVGISVFDGTNESDAQSTTGPYTATTWAHLIGVVDADKKTSHVYLNGIDVTGSSSPAAVALASTLRADAATFLGIDSPVGGLGMSGVLAGVAVYNGITLTSGQAANLYSAYTEFLGDTADERIAHIATIAGWTGATSLPVGRSTMPAADLAGRKALEAAQDAAKADGGILFADGAGVLTFIPRTALYNPTSLYTFGELTGSGEIPYNDIAFDYDVDKVVNDWQVSRPDGGTASATDTISQKRYFTRTATEELDVDSDDQTQAAADHWLALYKEPAVRVASVTIRPSQFSGALANLAWAACLGLDFGDCITVKRRPPGVATITAVCIVEKIHHRAVDGEWETEFGLTPADLTAYARWDIDQWDQEAWAW